MQLAHLYEGKQAHHGKRAAFGPEMMEFVRQQAVNFGTRIVTDDIVKVDFKTAALHAALARERRRSRPQAGHHRHRGAGQLPRPAVGGPLQEQRRLGLRRLRRGPAALPQQAARRRRRRRLGRRGGDLPDQVRQHRLPGAPPRRAAGQQDHAERALTNPKITMKWNRGSTRCSATTARASPASALKSTVDGEIEELAASGVFLAIGHTPNTDFLEGQLELDEKKYIQLDEAAAHLHQRRGRVRRRRRGRQLLPPGGHGGRHRAAWRRWTPSAGWPSRGIIENKESGARSQEPGENAKQSGDRIMTSSPARGPRLSGSDRCCDSRTLI